MMGVQSVEGCLLFPTDFQQPARRAFSYGISLARLLAARMEILHVIKTPADPSGPPPDSRYLSSLETSALLELGRLARTAREAGARAEPRLRFGVPDACILQDAAQRCVSLVVMGTEGRTGWDRLRLGSTVHRVVSRAACPVLAVHGGVAGDVARHPAHGKLKRVLLATDFSSCADEARRAVAALAKLAVARICVVHVGSGGSVEKAVRWKLDRVTAALRRQGIEADGADLTGEPVEAILAHAAGWEADVIAVGTKGRRGLSRLVLGSVAEGLLRRAGCPVLVVKKAVPLVRACGPGGRGRNTR